MYSSLTHQHVQHGLYALHCLTTNLSGLDQVHDRSLRVPGDFIRHYAYYNACVTSAARRAVDIAEREVLALRASKERTKRIKELRAQKEAKLLRAQSRYDTMTHIKDRDVVDWWESDETIEDNVTAIRVEGYEVGRFWCFADSKILPAVGC